MARLQKFYQEELLARLKTQLGCENIMQVPRLQKITLNMGLGEASRDKKILEFAVRDLSLISGQKPLITRSRQSIAGFKIRQGMPIGCKVTLRGKRMYEFLDRLVNIALPRVRDFRGLKARAFDGRGNYTLGIKEQIVFPEIEYDKIDKIRGLDVTLTIKARSDDEARALLKSFSFPLKD